MSEDNIGIYTKEMQSVFKEKEYEDFIDKMDYKGFCEYLRKNQGQTLQEINDKYNTKERYVKCLLNIWTENWNSFYHEGGRIVNKNGNYYILSPRNPQSRVRNPQINFL
tara:strand:- start:317 stop:643 length:327 start_codon:yes stop_codon:yes gene_type:complete